MKKLFWILLLAGCSHQQPCAVNASKCKLFMAFDEHGVCRCYAEHCLRGKCVEMGQKP